MRIHVLYFGVLKDLFHGERSAVDLPAGASVTGLLEHLRPAQADELPVWQSIAIAVNREYASRATLLQDGDEVALLPPVSGGSHAR